MPTRTVRIRTRPLDGPPQMGDNPAMYIDAAHWALEIVGESESILVELQVQMGVKSSFIITTGSGLRDFFDPPDVPKILQDDFAGSTTLSDLEIRQKADYIISQQPVYDAINNNCQTFVVNVALAIITEPTEGLKARAETDPVTLSLPKTYVLGFMGPYMGMPVIQTGQYIAAAAQKGFKILKQSSWWG